MYIFVILVYGFEFTTNFAMKFRKGTSGFASNLEVKNRGTLNCRTIGIPPTSSFLWCFDDGFS